MFFFFHAKLFWRERRGGAHVYIFCFLSHKTFFKFLFWVKAKITLVIHSVTLPNMMYVCFLHKVVKPIFFNLLFLLSQNTKEHTIKIFAPQMHHHISIPYSFLYKYMRFIKSWCFWLIYIMIHKSWRIWIFILELLCFFLFCFCWLSILLLESFCCVNFFASNQVSRTKNKKSIYVLVYSLSYLTLSFFLSYQSIHMSLSFSNKHMSLSFSNKKCSIFFFFLNWLYKTLTHAHIEKENIH
jgi:hypothetical protein